MTTDINEILDELSEDQELNFTNSVRKRLINSITKDLTAMPSDIKDQSILLQALDGIDKQMLAKKKIKSDEGISDKQALASEAIAQLFNTKDLKKMSISDIEGSIKELDSNLPNVQIIEGELDQTSKVLDYNSFMKN